MTRPIRWFLLAVLAAPFVSYFVYRLAKGLGFLDPPWNPEHEHRRTIVAALYAFLLFLSIFLFGYANAWPRVWALFGVVNAITLLIFVGLGATAARRLWKLRHPKADEQTNPEAPSADDPAEKPLG
ncbi:MAG: hypothetical protein WEB59_12575 [Thermoanaerobaculia bacterium]